MIVSGNAVTLPPPCVLYPLGFYHLASTTPHHHVSPALSLGAWSCQRTGCHGKQTFALTTHLVVMINLSEQLCRLLYYCLLPYDEKGHLGDSVAPLYLKAMVFLESINKCA